MSTPKRIWFIRHGEAEHNVLMESGHSKEGREIRDPALSSLGVEQARGLVDDIIFHGAVLSPDPKQRAELFVASPCRRALQTALEARGAASRASRGLEMPPVLAHPDLQECGEYPCDTGRPKDVLEEEFPEVDFKELSAQPNNWFIKPGVKNGGVPMLLLRCQRVTNWLAARPESRIVVVAHSTLFAFLLQVDFANCEVVEMRLCGVPRAPAAAAPADAAAALGRGAAGAGAGPRSGAGAAAFGSAAPGSFSSAAPGAFGGAGLGAFAGAAPGAFSGAGPGAFAGAAPGAFGAAAPGAFAGAAPGAFGGAAPGAFGGAGPRAMGGAGAGGFGGAGPGARAAINGTGPGALGGTGAGAFGGAGATAFGGPGAPAFSGAGAGALAGAAAGPGLLPPEPGVASAEEAWRKCWELTRAADRVLPFYNSKGSPITMCGSPPLRGTLATCFKSRGERSARSTAQRAGLELPPWMAMVA